MNLSIQFFQRNLLQKSLSIFILIHLFLLTFGFLNLTNQFLLLFVLSQKVIFYLKTKDFILRPKEFCLILQGLKLFN